MKKTLICTYIFCIFIRITIMNTKLTIKLDKEIIEKAKLYAEKHNISLSRMIESYLASLTTENREESEVTPLVKSLSGVIQLEPDSDIKKDYTDYLSDKYK